MNRRSMIVGLVVVTVFILIISYSAVRNKDTRPKRYRSIVSAQAEPLYKQASALIAQGNTEEAKKAYQKITEDFDRSDRAGDAWYELGKLYEAEGELLEAKEAYKKVVNGYPNYNSIASSQEKLWDVNMKILFSPTLTSNDTSYTVESGNTLGGIAKKFNTTVELIMKSNNLKSDLIKPGMKLKISTTTYSIVIDKSQNLLTLKSNDEVIKTYMVSTGKDNGTPVGTFKIVEKLVNPPWYTSKGVILPGSPDNILGSRWMGISVPEYGIHGGGDPQVLGKQETKGCVRMINADVEELFAIVPVGTEVTIVD